ncbi:hypothetical protein CR513_21274, partial [Mucuna pruriens]
MSLFVRSILLLFVFMLVSLSNVLARTHVSITNNLKGNQYLTVHCKSKNDDRGVQRLGIRTYVNCAIGMLRKVDHVGRECFMIVMKKGKSRRDKEK